MQKTYNSQFKYDVSVIIPIYNGERWINECFEAILNQTSIGNTNFEVCVCDDASTDNTQDLLNEWTTVLSANQINVSVFKNSSGHPKGVGYGKNKAIGISKGEYLCFQDVDDVMLPNRILIQFSAARNMNDHVLLGSMFERKPFGSTVRYTRWANTLTEDQCNQQIYTSHGPTIIMPTWFCHRNVFERVGGFSEDGKGTPEDLIFFYKHLDNGGRISRINETLVIYNYHQEATTFSIKEKTIWDLRVKQLEKIVLSKWTKFTIWNAGKQGRRFYNSICKNNQEKVIALCDVDEKKIGKFYESFNADTRTPGRRIDIVHFKKASPPFIICVKLDMTKGNFEQNLSSLNLIENEQYVYFN